MILIVFPEPGVVGYSLLAYSDVGDGNQVDGLGYHNTPLSSCEVFLINISQFGSEAVQQSVSVPVKQFD
jgi:hypothetical protein